MVWEGWHQASAFEELLHICCTNSRKSCNGNRSEDRGLGEHEQEAVAPGVRIGMAGTRPDCLVHNAARGTALTRLPVHIPFLEDEFLHP